MIDRVLEIKDEGDTAGGIVEIIARNRRGSGAVFDRLNATLAHGLKVGAVRASSSAGFGVAKLKGSECNDIPSTARRSVQDQPRRRIGGGISNGEDIVIRVEVKPTATIS